MVVRGSDGETLPRPGNAGPAVDPAVTTRVAEFNDLTSVEQALAHGDVAVLITEPALTNIGTERSCSSTRRTPSAPAQGA